MEMDLTSLHGHACDPKHTPSYICFQDVSVAPPFACTFFYAE